MFKKLALVAIATLALGAVTADVKAETNLDFKLINKTGYGISEVYIGPTTSDEWGDSIIDEVLENNESVDVSFAPQAAGIAKWDLMVTFVDDESNVYWRGFKLSEINSITLKYNRETEETSAVTQ